MSKSKYLVTIGLEVHVQLATKTKIFCSCAVKFAEAANSNVCPVCLGLPGALPVLNKQVFELGMKAALALGGEISKKVKFDRKNYFYPDLPKGYQISQFDMPLGKGGQIEVSCVDGSIKAVRINRLHLEEDAGKLIHDQSDKSSLVDLNRAGTPLAEIVSEPDMDTADQAYEYLNSLKAIMKAVGASECDMEKGHLRCDANVSIRKNSSDPLGKKVEIKNLNSFKAVKSAIEYEIIRQSEALDGGHSIAQETRLWDDGKQKTFSMRSKEEAHDYRYFPEPDLVPFFIEQKTIDAVKAALPELPKQKRERFESQYALSAYDAALLTAQPEVCEFYERCVELNAESKAVANWMIGPVFASLTSLSLSLNQTQLKPEHIVNLCQLVRDNKISFQAAKDKVLLDVMQTGEDPEKIINTKGLQQVSDESSLVTWASEAIAENPKVVEDFKTGKDSAVMFLVGQAMKKSKGKANPVKVQEVVRKLLSQA